MPDVRPTVILTRPEAQSVSLAEACRRRFGDDLPVIVSPILGIEYLPLARALGDYPTLAFTSSNGVAAIAGRDDLEGVRAMCVGRKTAEEAAALGMAASAGAGGVEGLLAHILDVRPPAPVLHLRGEYVRGDLAGDLRAAGIEADETVVYRQVPEELNAAALAVLAGTAPVVLPVFSPRSAALMSDAVARSEVRAPLRVVAISPAAASAWTAPAERIGIAETPEADAMLDAIGRMLRG